MAYDENKVNLTMMALQEHLVRTLHVYCGVALRVFVKYWASFLSFFF